MKRSRARRYASGVRRCSPWRRSGRRLLRPTREYRRRRPLAIVALVIAALLRSWRRPAPSTADRVTPLGVNATDDELARLEAAVRSDDR